MVGPYLENCFKMTRPYLFVRKVIFGHAHLFPPPCLNGVSVFIAIRVYSYPIEFFRFSSVFFVRSFVRARSSETDSQKICGPSARKFFARNFFSCAVVAPSSKTVRKLPKTVRNGLKTVRNDPKTVRNGPKRCAAARRSARLGRAACAKRLMICLK